MAAVPETGRAIDADEGEQQPSGEDAQVDNDNAVQGKVMLVVRSTPMRKILACALHAQKLDVIEAVNPQEALHIMQTEAIPHSFIVGGSLGEQRDAVGLIRGIQNVPRISGLPAVILCNGSTALSDAREEGFPEHIVIIEKEPTPERLVDRTLHAREEALALSGMVDEDTEIEDPVAVLSSVGSAGGMQEAAAFMVELVKMVATNRLPGPMMPRLLEEVRELFADPDVEFPKIAQLVKREQSLSVRLMALVNSAFYTRGDKVSKPEQAVSRLGLNKTAALLQAAAVNEFVVGDNPDLHELIRANLRRAFLVALVSERMGKQSGVSGEDAYTIGLFHNVGSTFLCYTFAMMLHEGKVEEIDPDAIRTISESKAEDLNRLVYKGMNLPDEVDMVFATGFKVNTSQASKGIVGLVHRSMWVADRVLNDKLAELELDEDGQCLGVTQRDVDTINEFLQGLVATVNTCYSA